MTKNELLSQLYEAERSAQALYPVVQKEIALNQEKQKLQEALSSKESDKSMALFWGIGGLVAAIISLICAAVANSIGSMIFAFVCAIFAVIKFLSVPIKLIEIKSFKEDIANADARIAETQNLLAQMRCELALGIQIYQTMMPQDCILPNYARKFISYIETDQATSIPEARKLFEEFLHREKMEALAAQQIIAASAASAATIAAINRATDAANNAASAARNAEMNTAYLRK